MISNGNVAELKADLCVRSFHRKDEGNLTKQELEQAKAALLVSGPGGTPSEPARSGWYPDAHGRPGIEVWGNGPGTRDSS